jgi:hypothetical protein
MKATQTLLIAIIFLLSLNLFLGFSLPASGQHKPSHQPRYIQQDRLPLKGIGMENISTNSWGNDQGKQEMIKKHKLSPCMGMSAVLDPKGNFHLFRVFRDGIVEKYDGQKWTTEFKLDVRK